MKNDYERLIKEFEEKNKDNVLFQTLSKRIQLNDNDSVFSILDISAVDLDTGRYAELYEDMIVCIDIIETTKVRKLWTNREYDKIREIPQIKILLDKMKKVERTQEEIDALFDK